MIPGHHDKVLELQVKPQSSAGHHIDPVTCVGKCEGLQPCHLFSLTPSTPSSNVLSCSLSTLAPSCLWGTPTSSSSLAFRKGGCQGFQEPGREDFGIILVNISGLGQGVGLQEQRQHKLPERGPQQPSSPSHQDILGWQTMHSNYKTSRAG